MNKHITQNILRFLVLMIVTLSSGCDQLIDPEASALSLTPSQLKANVVSTALPEKFTNIETPTSIPCLTIAPSSSEIEKIADEWFKSTTSDFLARDNYNSEEMPKFRRERFCKDYLVAMASDDYWINEPILFAMRFAGYPNADGLAPDSVKVFFRESNPQIATVIILDKNLMDDSIVDKEMRIDIVKDENTWKIKWFGYRQRCSRSSNDWVANRCP